MSDLSNRQLDALNRVEANAALQPLFFRKLSGLQWFDELDNRGFFSPDHNPEPVESNKEGYFTIPGWPILDYLKTSAPELQLPGNEQFIDKFLAVIRGVTNKAIEDNKSNHRTWWFFAQILQYVPVEKLAKEDISVVRYWLADKYDRLLVWTEIGKTLLPKLLADDTDHARALATGILTELTCLLWREKRWGAGDEQEAYLQVDNYHATEVLSAQAKSVGEKLEVAGVDVFKNRLAETFEHTNNELYSTIWRPAIEDHDQNQRSDEAPSILISSFRDSLIGYVSRSAAAATGYIQALIDSDVIVFQRVAIFIVDSFAAPLQNLIPGFIDKRWFNYQYQHEIYNLLNSCVSDFDEKAVEDLLQIIREVAVENRDADQPDEIQAKQEAYEALRWLSAIKGCGSKEVEVLHAHYLSVTNEEPSHPDFSSYMESGWVGKESSHTTEELLSRDFPGLVGILNSFEEEKGWRTPTRRGLALTLKDALKSKPDFFKGNLHQLIGVHYDYTHMLLDGYRELWKEDKNGNWAELLQFSSDLIHSEGFWPQKIDVGEPVVADYGWVVGSIGDLVRAGTVDDAAAFDEDLMPSAKELIEYALAHQAGANFVDKKDSVSVSINSARGKLIEALINLALRSCRIADKHGDGHQQTWENELQPFFDAQVENIGEGNYEFVTLFANYLPNLLYLSWTWTMNALPKIFNKEDRIGWVSAVQGYTYVNQIYADVYQFLRENEHIKDALDAEEFESRGKDKLIQNVVIAYLRGDEQIDDENGLLHLLLERWRPEEIRELIWFIWTLRDGHQEEYAQKVLLLWSAISGRANLEQLDDQKILARASSLSAFVGILDDETTELIIRCAPYVELEHDSYILIEHLRRLVDDYPQQVGKIYSAMIGAFAPTYKQEHIEHILTVLYESGGDLRQTANMIFEKYLEYAVEFAVDLRARLAD